MNTTPTPELMPFDITPADIGRYVRDKQSGRVGVVKKDAGNGWLYPDIFYEWKYYRDDLEYVEVTATPPAQSDEVAEAVALEVDYTGVPDKMVIWPISHNMGDYLAVGIFLSDLKELQKRNMVLRDKFMSMQARVIELEAERAASIPSVTVEELAAHLQAEIIHRQIKHVDPNSRGISCFDQMSWLADNYPNGVKITKGG